MSAIIVVKAIKVIDSCTTRSHVDTAYRYLDLVHKHLPHDKICKLEARIYNRALEIKKLK